MTHFRLNLMLLTLMLIAVCVGIGMAIGSGEYATYAVLLVIAVIFIVAGLARIVWQPVHLMAYFVKALWQRDFMMRFPKSDDREMREMLVLMNKIVEIYRDNLNEIETKRLYYDRILKVMSHELRNSITPIVSLSSDMLKRPDCYHGEQLYEGLEVINGQCVGIKRFLDSYYELTHLPQPQMAAIDVAQMMVQTKRLFDHELLKPEYSNTRMSFSYGDNMSVEGDEPMLRQVLVNLIKNALQATRDTPRPCIEIMASTPNGVPYITVTDNGTGIPDNIIDDIFQPFYTTHPDGSGIGLCISRQIMRLHNGDLTVMSKVGRGSQFMMTFS